MWAYLASIIVPLPTIFATSPPTTARSPGSSAVVTPRRSPPSFAPLFEMGTLGTQRRVVTVPGVDHCGVGVDVEHQGGDVVEERVELRRFRCPPKTTGEQAVTGEQVGGPSLRVGAIERQRDGSGGVTPEVDDVEGQLPDLDGVAIGQQSVRFDRQRF